MKSIITIFKLVFKAYFLIFALTHLAFFTTPRTVRFLTFQDFLNFPFGNLSNPLEFGQENVHNFYINAGKSSRIGIWHFIPREIKYSPQIDSLNSIEQHFNKYFKVYDNRPIVIYAHGSDRNRAASSRCALTDKLRNIGYHVFALDYRAYGDSTSDSAPTETSVVEDVLLLYNFIKSYQKDGRIFLWGHSLGSGIVTHAAKILSEFHAPPAGIVLESPFLNIAHAATEYFISPFIYNNPWIIDMGNKALKEMNIAFENDKHIVKINSKILIFHAEDDWFIPHDRAMELFRIAETQRPKDYPKVELRILDREHGLGHSNIYQHEEIYPIVKKFIF